MPARQIVWQPQQLEFDIAIAAAERWLLVWCGGVWRVWLAGWLACGLWQLLDTLPLLLEAIIRTQLTFDISDSHSKQALAIS